MIHFLVNSMLLHPTLKNRRLDSSHVFKQELKKVIYLLFISAANSSDVAIVIAIAIRLMSVCLCFVQSFLHEPLLLVHYFLSHMQ